MRPQRVHHPLANLVFAEPGFGDPLRAEVAGHDHDSVAEIHRAALRVRQAAVVEQLQQHIQHVGVRLLDLVE